MAADIEALKVLAASTDENVRLQAIKGLYESQDMRAMAVLVQLTSQDVSVKVRYLAKKAIFLLRKVLRNELKNTSAFSGEFKSPQMAAGKVEKVVSQIDGQLKEPANKTAETSINLPEFISAYEQANSDTRIWYIQSAVRYNAVDVLPFLSEEAPKEQDPHVRATLAISLGILGDENEIHVIAHFLQDSDPRVRANAIEGLEYTGSPKAYPFIMRFLTDRDNRIRGNVVKALKSYGKVNLAHLLEKMIRSDKLWMRDSAAYCMTVLASVSLLPLVEIGLRDKSGSVRRKCHLVLERLAASGEEKARLLLDRFADDDFDGEPPEDNAKVDNAHLDSLSEGATKLFSEDVAVRKREIDRIVAEKDAEQIPNMLQLLGLESEPFIKACLVTALGRLGSPMAADSLTACLKEDIARVRANAVEALAVVAPERLTEHADELLYDDNNRVRANAIGALINSCEDKALTSLAEMVSSADELHRRSAFWAVSDIGDERVKTFIQAFLSDESEEIRERAVLFVHQLREQNGQLADLITSGLDEKTRKQLSGPMATQQAVEAFEEELPLLEQSTTDFLGASSDLLSIDGMKNALIPSLSAPSKRFKYETFRNKSKEQKLDIIDEAKGMINIANFSFLREVLRKEKDFVVKVAVRRALKSFEKQNFSDSAILRVSGDGPSILEAPHVRAISYRGAKSVLKLSQELIVRGKKRDATMTWLGPFGQRWQMLNALREDTQDMILEILGDDEVLATSLCYFNDRLTPFLKGERSLDMNRYANIVSLASVVNRVKGTNPQRALLTSINRPAYMLVILTARRCILFLRGTIEDRQARYLVLHYRNMSSLQFKDKGALCNIVVTVGNEEIELPELLMKEASWLYGFIERKQIEETIQKDTGGNVPVQEDLCLADSFFGISKDQMLAIANERTVIAVELCVVIKGDNEEQTIDLEDMLELEDDVLMPHVRAHEGAVIRRKGQTLVISFDDPLEAVLCSTALLEALDEHNEKRAKEVLATITIDTGGVTVKDADVTGATVQRAQALQKFGERMGVVMSKATHEAVAKKVLCTCKGSRSLSDGSEVVIYIIDEGEETVA